jgi:hypothetical protein
MKSLNFKNEFFISNEEDEENDKFVKFKIKDSISSMDSSLSILNEEQKKAVDNKVKSKNIFFGKDKLSLKLIQSQREKEMTRRNFMASSVISNKHLLCKCHVTPIEKCVKEIKKKIILKKIPVLRKNIV